jgi:hypothetical protein
MKRYGSDDRVLAIEMMNESDADTNGQPGMQGPFHWCLWSTTTIPIDA